jgi:hypothetical protein
MGLATAASSRSTPPRTANGPKPGEAVGHQASHGSEDQDRQDLEGDGSGDANAGVGEIEDEDQQRHRVERITGSRDGVGDEQPSEGPIVTQQLDHGALSSPGRRVQGENGVSPISAGPSASCRRTA